MNYYEVEQLPEVCLTCEEEDCYNCDHALERWEMSKLDRLKMKRALKIVQLKRIMEHTEKIEAEIDKVEAEIKDLDTKIEEIES